LNFPDTVKALKADGLLAEVNAPISPDYEIPWLASRLAKSTIKALLFSNVQEKSFRLITNVYYGKAQLVFREGVSGLRERFRRWLTLFAQFPADHASKLSKLASLAWMADVLPRVRDSAKGFLQSSSFDLDLTELPALRHHVGEEFPVIKNPVVVFQDREAKTLEVFSQPVQVVDEKTLLIHIPHRTRAFRLIEDVARHGGTLNVAVVVGAPPYLQLAAGINWIPWVDKYMLAGELSGSPLELMRLDNGMYVPAEAEMIITGELVPGDVRPEGKMLYEDLRLYGGSPMPVVRAKTLLYKPSALFYTSITNPLLSDVASLKEIEEKLLLEFIQQHIPSVIGVKYIASDAYRTMIVALDGSQSVSALEVGGLLFSINVNPYLDTVVVLKCGARCLESMKDDSRVLTYLISSLQHGSILAASATPLDDVLRSERKTRIIVDATSTTLENSINDYIEGVKDVAKLTELYARLSQELRDAQS